MSFDHKAYEFDWEQFTAELAPLLMRALADDDATALGLFIDGHLPQCANPYDGEPLDARWRTALETGSMQEVADFALTACYRPAKAFGIGDIWSQLTADLGAAAQQALLGTPFGPPQHLFDPGLQGSYFQTPAQVRTSTQNLANSNHAEIALFHKQLIRVTANQKGLYVTF